MSAGEEECCRRGNSRMPPRDLAWVAVRASDRCQGASRSCKDAGRLVLRAGDHVEQRQSLTGALLPDRNRRVPWLGYSAVRYLVSYPYPWSPRNPVRIAPIDVEFVLEIAVWERPAMASAESLYSAAARDAGLGWVPQAIGSRPTARTTLCTPVSQDGFVAIDRWMEG
jgi:hypothetical protein